VSTPYNADLRLHQVAQFDPTTNARPLHVKAFVCAVFLMGRGFEPIGAQRARDGGIVYIFPAAAQSAFGAFVTAKERLNDLAEAVQSSEAPHVFPT
jgi:hypothetical protein